MWDHRAPKSVKSKVTCGKKKKTDTTSIVEVTIYELEHFIREQLVKLV